MMQKLENNGIEPAGNLPATDAKSEILTRSLRRISSAKTAKMLFPCDQCKVPKVEARGRICLTCAELLEMRKRDDADRLETRSMLIRFVGLCLFGFALMMLIRWFLEFSKN